MIGAKLGPVAFNLLRQRHKRIRGVDVLITRGRNHEMSFRKRMLKHGPRTGVLAASIGTLIATGGLTGTALGQEEDEEEASAADDAIVVTGTRDRKSVV